MFAPDRMLATSVHANEHAKLEDQKERWKYREALPCAVCRVWPAQTAPVTRHGTLHLTQECRQCLARMQKMNPLTCRSCKRRKLAYFKKFQLENNLSIQSHNSYIKTEYLPRLSPATVRATTTVFLVVFQTLMSPLTRLMKVETAGMFLNLLANYLADKNTDPRVTCAATILGSAAHLASYVD
jgi:hypothetical protein